MQIDLLLYLNPSLCELFCNFISMIGLRVLLEIKTFSLFFYYIDFFKKLGFHRENKSSVDEFFFFNFITSDDFIKKRFDYKEHYLKNGILKKILSLHIFSHINREVQTSGYESNVRTQCIYPRIYHTFTILYRIHT